MSILKSLSELVLINELDLYKYICTAPYRYKKFKILKRNKKGFRDIAQPTKELKYLQRKAVQKLDIISELPIHSSAKAYMKGINIFQNAEAHKNNQFLLKMDFSNFFPSLNPSDLISYIEENYSIELDIYDKKIVSNLFFYRKRRNKPLELSIGAPSSPHISNILMYKFDVIVSDFCKLKNITYTRYADDLTFSTNEKEILFNLPVYISDICTEIQHPRLLVNELKTVFLSKKGNRHVTGLVISNNNKVSIGRKKKRYIKSLVYNFSNGVIDKSNLAYLKGYLSFCSSFDQSFVRSLESKYGKEILEAIKKG